MKRALNLFLTTVAAIAPVGIIISCSTSNNLVSRSDLFKPEGGQINGLQVDKYLNVVKALELKPNVNLTDLTPQTLNQRIQKIEPQAYVEIIDGSTAGGFLKLRVSQNSNFQLNQSAADEAIELTINGFQTNLPAMFEYVFKPWKLGVTNPNLNEKAWIEALLPIENNNSNTMKKISETSSLTWNKILNDEIEVILLNDQSESKQSQASKPVISTLGELKEKGFNFDVSATEIKENNEIQFDISAQINHYIYNSQTGSWNVDVKNRVIIPQAAAEKAKTKIPSDKAAKQYVLDKTTFFEEKLPKFYPSLIRALGEYNEGIIVPDGSQKEPFTIKEILKNELIDEAANQGTSQNIILKTYFAGKKLALAINPRSIVADDYVGMLILSVNLIIDDEDDWQVETVLSSEGTNKKLSDNLPTFRQNANVWTLKTNATLQTNLLNALKKDAKTKATIDKFFNSQTLDQTEAVIDTNDFIGNQVQEPIYSFDETAVEDAKTKHENLINKFKENFEQLKLFGQELVFQYPIAQTIKQATTPANPDLSKTTINFKAGLLIFQNNTFQIDLLETSFNDQKLGENKTKVTLKAVMAENAGSKLKVIIKGQNTIVLPPNGEQIITENFDLTVETEIDQTLWNQTSQTN